MSIKNVLIEIKTISKENSLSEPFIVGGMPRDKVLGISRLVQDIDITTGDDSINKLANFVCEKFNTKALEHEDKHLSTIIGKVKFDFSSNFNSPDAVRFLEKAGVSIPTNMQIELFSRDFTCNTLIIPMNLRKIQDPTGLGLNDIKKKILRTPLPPRITLRDDPRRVLRAIYLAAKLGFNIEEDIIEWVINNHNKISEFTKPVFSKKKLAEAVRYNKDKVIELLSIMKLWDVLDLPSVLFSSYRGLKNKK